MTVSEWGERAVCVFQEQGQAYVMLTDVGNTCTHLPGSHHTHAGTHGHHMLQR